MMWCTDFCLGAPAARGPTLPANASSTFVAQLVAMKHWDTIGFGQTIRGGGVHQKTPEGSPAPWRKGGIGGTSEGRGCVRVGCGGTRARVGQRRRKGKSGGPCCPHFTSIIPTLTRTSLSQGRRLACILPECKGRVPHFSLVCRPHLAAMSPCHLKRTASL